jgi:hypothetical protein
VRILLGFAALSNAISKKTLFFSGTCEKVRSEVKGAKRALPLSLRLPC